MFEKMRILETMESLEACNIKDKYKTNLLK